MNKNFRNNISKFYRHQVKAKFSQHKKRIIFSLLFLAFSGGALSSFLYQNDTSKNSNILTANSFSRQPTTQVFITKNKPQIKQVLVEKPLENDSNTAANSTTNLPVEKVKSENNDPNLAAQNLPNKDEKILSLKQELDEFQKQQLKQQAEIEFKNQQISENQTQIEQKIEENKQIAKKIHNISLENNFLNNKVKQSDTFISNLKSEIDSKDNNIKNLQTQISDLENNKKTLIANFGNLQTQNISLTENLQETEKNLQNLKLELAKNEKEKTLLNDNLQIKEQENQQIKFKITQQETNINNLHSELERQQSQIENLSQKNTSLQQKIEDLEQNLQTSQNQIRQLENELAIQRQNYQKLENKFDNLKTKHNNLVDFAQNLTYKTWVSKVTNHANFTLSHFPVTYSGFKTPLKLEKTLIAKWTIEVENSDFSSLFLNFGDFSYTLDKNNLTSTNIFLNSKSYTKEAMVWKDVYEDNPYGKSEYGSKQNEYMAKFSLNFTNIIEARKESENTIAIEVYVEGYAQQQGANTYFWTVRKTRSSGYQKFYGGEPELVNGTNLIDVIAYVNPQNINLQKVSD